MEKLQKLKYLKNYSNAVLVIGGILFYRGIYMLTEFYGKNKKNDKSYMGGTEILILKNSQKQVWLFLPFWYK